MRRFLDAKIIGQAEGREDNGANLDREKRNQCWSSGCECFEMRCKAYHGKECKRLGGDRIPRMRLIKPEMWVDKRPSKITPPSTRFKPYFMSPNTMDRDGEPFESFI
ncbi:hypothetical protein [Desulfosporosinus sp. OT]|uniref:hypothetical protein n=1 Tax=Desulfosporosinus sp. OT TaxID=913865 RepID=UPI00058EA5F7|nr:hypothetical protein [Desulfosporosinus sp. OT]